MSFIWTNCNSFLNIRLLSGTKKAAWKAASSVSTVHKKDSTMHQRIDLFACDIRIPKSYVLTMDEVWTFFECLFFFVLIFFCFDTWTVKVPFFSYFVTIMREKSDATAVPPPWVPSNLPPGRFSPNLLLMLHPVPQPPGIRLLWPPKCNADYLQIPPSLREHSPEIEPFQWRLMALFSSFLAGYK